VIIKDEKTLYHKNPTKTTNPQKNYNDHLLRNKDKHPFVINEPYCAQCHLIFVLLTLCLHYIVYYDILSLFYFNVSIVICVFTWNIQHTLVNITY